MAIGVALCKVGGGPKLLRGDASAENGSANVRQAGLLLRVNAHMVAIDVRGDLFRLARIEGITQAALEFGKKRAGGPAMLEEQEFQASFFAAVAKNFTVAEDFRDTADDRNDLIPLNEGIKRDAEMRVRREPPADAKCETCFEMVGALAQCGGQADIVDFRVGAPVPAARDGNLEFAWKIIELCVSAKLAVERESERRGVAKLVGIEAGERAAGDVARDVAAGAGRGEAGFPKGFEDFRERFDGDPMQLNILAYREVGHAAGVSFGEIGNGADLIAAEETVGDANAHHKKRRGEPFTVFAADDAGSVTLGVNTPGTEVGAEPFGRNGSVSVPRELADFVEMVPGVLGPLEAFNALCFGLLLFAHAPR